MAKIDLPDLFTRNELESARTKGELMGMARAKAYCFPFYILMAEAFGSIVGQGLCHQIPSKSLP